MAKKNKSESKREGKNGSKGPKKFTKRLGTDRVYNWVDEDPKDAGKPKARLFLVDRMWPVGVKKERLALEAWPKELAPSTELRKRFHGKAVAGKKKARKLSYGEFAKAYRAELDERLDSGELDDIMPDLKDGLKKAHKKYKKGKKGKKNDKKALDKRPVKLLFAAKNKEKSHANVLKQWLMENL
ncbi:MAG TPA: DUF488 family protein [Candidatus Corynebacterium gallistercoris]|uniref:DUF488 family protein n=1 Tax=Candidatus Corynebacterium gallistercoris TaxID=2838530 RepID=A0A9D1RZ81_9CORY|nr:DUF488 family protein [Candidatus Corynebacterium gallistercoris]